MVTSMPPATESALLVEVPAAEPAVADRRAELDRAAGWGVPAHITLLYPFVPPARLGADVLAATGEAVAVVAAFELVLATVRWFGDDVVWAAPEEPAPLRLLIARLRARFPQYPPYGGTIADPEPHLTIGHLGSPADRWAAAVK